MKDNIIGRKEEIIKLEKEYLQLLMLPYQIVINKNVQVL